MEQDRHIAVPHPPFPPVDGPELNAYLDPSALAHQARSDIETLAARVHAEMEGRANLDEPLTLRDVMAHGDMGAIKRLDALQDALEVRFWLDLAHAERMQQGHTIECHVRSEQDDFNLRRAFGLRMAYRQRHPGFCWLCGGSGASTDHDVSTGVVSYEPCGACVEQGACPRRGAHAWNANVARSEDAHGAAALDCCQACGWMADAPSLTSFPNPARAECHCPDTVSLGWPLPVSRTQPQWGWKRDGNW